jgi:hypothetical protein
MNTNGFLAYDANSMVLLPLAEPPTLRLAEAFVRMWAGAERRVLKAPR